MTCTQVEPLLRTRWESTLSDRSQRRSTRRIFIRRPPAVWSSPTAWTPASSTRRACPTSIASSTMGCLRPRLASLTATTLALSSTSGPPLRRKACSSISRRWRKSTNAMRTGSPWSVWSRTCRRRAPTSTLRPWHKTCSRSPRKHASASSISNEHRITSCYWKAHNRGIHLRCDGAGNTGDIMTSKIHSAHLKWNVKRRIVWIVYIAHVKIIIPTALACLPTSGGNTTHVTFIII